MLIKLPVKVNEKIHFENFFLEYYDNYFKLSQSKNTELNYLDVIFTNSYGINSYSLYFPIYFYI